MSGEVPHGVHQTASRGNPARENQMQRPYLDASPRESRWALPAGDRQTRPRRQGIPDSVSLLAARRVGHATVAASPQARVEVTARRGDEGYEAPYALVIFAVLGIACAIVAIVSWRQPGHTTATMAFYGAFFLANACSFLYTTRRGKCQVWDEILDGLRAEDERAAADRGHGARRFPVLGEERESVRVLHDGHAAGDDVYRQQQLHGRVD